MGIAVDNKTDMGDTAARLKGLRRRAKEKRQSVSGLFNTSLTSSLSRGFCRGVLRLRLKVLGVFFVTFGIYSLIVALLTHFFTIHPSDEGAVYFSICMAATSLPLLLSGGTVSTALMNSPTGGIICEFLGIKRESVRDFNVGGHLNWGFIAGVACGTLTLALPPATILSVLVLAAAALIILSVPETGPVFCVIGLFACGEKYQFLIVFTTLVSYIIKLARGKRSLSLKKTDAVAAAFALCVAGGAVMWDGSIRPVPALRYLLVICVYFLVLLLFRDCRRLTRLAAVMGAVGGLTAAAYIIGRVLLIALQRSAMFDQSFVFDAVNSLPAFSSGWASAAFSALIPLSAGLALRRHDSVSRRTMWLCVAAMAAALVLAGETVALFVSGVALVLLLLLCGRKPVYLVLLLLFNSAVLLSFSQRLGGRLTSVICDRLARDFDGVSGLLFNNSGIISKYTLCGRGLGSVSGDSSVSFLRCMADELGIIGLSVFILFIAAVSVEFILLCKKTVQTSADHSELRRFGAIRSGADTRIGAAAPLISCLSLLVCAVYTDLWKSPEAHLLIWLLCGMCTAYSRSAAAEITKAEEATKACFCGERAAVDIKLQ